MLNKADRKIETLNAALDVLMDFQKLHADASLDIQTRNSQLDAECTRNQSTIEWLTRKQESEGLTEEITIGSCIIFLKQDRAARESEKDKNTEYLFELNDKIDALKSEIEIGKSKDRSFVYYNGWLNQYFIESKLTLSINEILNTWSQRPRILKEKYGDTPKSLVAYQDKEQSELPADWQFFCFKIGLFILSVSALVLLLVLPFLMGASMAPVLICAILAVLLGSVGVIFPETLIGTKTAFYLMKASEKEVKDLDKSKFTQYSNSVEFFKGSNDPLNSMPLQRLGVKSSDFRPL